MNNGTQLITKKKILRLAVKGIYFHQIKAKEKKEEYRLYNEYWIKRLEGKAFDEIHITLGYPRSGDIERTLIRPWRGFRKKVISHKHFGIQKVQVFAIIVN
ncbi:ASCH domain-containing protein [Microbulbifer epialgicus]|uniref:ASCH domain-containing protein n=1 Tax=Microbulbifer epialgicus TaxID=393907 RepID=A0ABV4NTW1_9GAMM